MESKEISIKKVGEALKHAFCEASLLNQDVVSIAVTDPAPWGGDEVLISVIIPVGYIISPGSLSGVEGVKLFLIYSSSYYNQIRFDFVCKLK